MSTPLVVTLPLPPNMANMRAHWRTKEKKRKAWFNKAYFEQFDVVHGAPREPFSFARVAFTLYMHQHMDDDGALARCKWPLDFLVRARYLVDDDRKHCRLSIPEQVIDRKNPRVVVSITPEDS